MMSQSRLVLLDTNVVIAMFEYGIWEQITKRWTIVLAEEVARESMFYERDGERFEITREAIHANGKVEIQTVELSRVQAFCARFEPTYVEKLDPGETESLILLGALPDALICSADKIVWRVLGNIGERERGISLEELLQQCGLKRELDRRFTHGFRIQWTNGGFRDSLDGRGCVE